MSSNREEAAERRSRARSPIPQAGQPTPAPPPSSVLKPSDRGASKPSAKAPAAKPSASPYQISYTEPKELLRELSGGNNEPPLSEAICKRVLATSVKRLFDRKTQFAKTEDRIKNLQAHQRDGTIPAGLQSKLPNLQLPSAHPDLAARLKEAKAAFDKQVLAIQIESLERSLNELSSRLDSRSIILEVLKNDCHVNPEIHREDLKQKIYQQVNDLVILLDRKRSSIEVELSAKRAKEAERVKNIKERQEKANIEALANPTPTFNAIVEHRIQKEVKPQLAQITQRLSKIEQALRAGTSDSSPRGAGARQRRSKGKGRKGATANRSTSRSTSPGQRGDSRGRSPSRSTRSSPSPRSRSSSGSQRRVSFSDELSGRNAKGKRGRRGVGGDGRRRRQSKNGDVSGRAPSAGSTRF